MSPAFSEMTWSVLLDDLKVFFGLQLAQNSLHAHTYNPTICTSQPTQPTNLGTGVVPNRLG
jgi:hypothetical protein